MGDREIRKRLRRISAPGGDQAREQAIAKAQAELRNRHPRREARPALRIWRRWPAVVTAAAAALLAFGLTAPGRGLAEHLAEIVGIGDEPTEEPVFDTPESTTRPIVIGVGQSPSGVRFEVVASRYRGSGADAAESLCFRVSFPSLPRPGTLQCLTAAVLETFTSESTFPAAFEGTPPLGPNRRTVVVAIVGADVSTVRVEGSASQGQQATKKAQVFRLTPELQAELGTDVQAGYAVALLRDLGRGKGSRRSVEVASFGADGKELSRRSVAVGAAG